MTERRDRTIASLLGTGCPSLRGFLEERSSLGMALLDRSGSILDCNEGFRLLTGEPGKTPGRNLRDCLAPASRGKLEELPPGGASLPVPLDFLSRSAAVQAARCHFLDCGDTVLLACEKTAVDHNAYVTKMILLNAEIQENRERLGQIIDGSSIPTFVLDERHTITHWNRACANVTGIPASRMIGTREQWRAFYPAPRPVMADLVVDDAPEEEVSRHYSVKARNTVVDGAWEAEAHFPHFADGGKWLFFTAAPIRNRGRIIGAVETLQDVTESHRIRDELTQAKEAAEAANRSKSLFLANMSHEIRTPLNAVIGFSQLMCLDPALTPKLRESLDIILHSGEHLLSLINDILDMSKIDAGRTVATPTEFDLPALLGNLAAMFRQRAEGKGIGFRYEAADLPAGVVTDEGKLRQVLINLLGNAIKFTDRGEVVLRAAYQEERAGHGRLQVAVADTGPGMRPTEIGLLFQPFSQTTAGFEARGGTGLGLAISREYARLLGGDITVSSAFGEGSCFTLELPLKAGAGGGDAREAIGADTGLRCLVPGFRVLIADDSRVNRLLVQRMLEGAGFEILMAANGVEAVCAFAEHAPGLILMDISMPGMDGLEATRRIREAGGGKTTIVAMTAHAFAEQKERILAGGVDGYLSKPFVRKELFRVLRSSLPPGCVTLVQGRSAAAPEEAGREPSPEEIARVPRTLADALGEAVVSADMDAIEERLCAIGERSPELARRLRRLAGEYRYDEMRGILARWKPDGKETGT